MNILAWFSAKDVDGIAKKLADELSKKYPPSSEKDKQKKISEKRLTRILEELYDEAIEFRNNQKLGVYKKARLGNTFRWELHNLGYSDEFVNVATEGMVVYLSRK